MELSRTTLRTVEILKPVSKKPNDITLDEIYAEPDMSKTDTYDIVTTLVQTDMIRVTREQKRGYTIGLIAYRIGINYTNSLDFISTIDPTLRVFPRRVGKTVFFGIRSDNPIVYTRKFEPGNPVTTTAAVETRNPTYCTSLGKAIMAYMEDEDRDDVLFRIGLKKHAGRTVCTREEFEKELESARRKGYTFDAKELEEHMEYVEAFVFRQDGNVMGAISVPSLYKSTEDCGTLGRLVSGKGTQLSRLLGYIKHVWENKLTFSFVLLLANHVTVIRTWIYKS